MQLITQESRQKELSAAEQRWDYRLRLNLSVFNLFESQPETLTLHKLLRHRVFYNPLVLIFNQSGILVRAAVLGKVLAWGRMVVSVGYTNSDGTKYSSYSDIVVKIR